MKTTLLLLALLISFSSLAFEIKFIPFEISTYERVTAENIDEKCSKKGSYSLGTLKVVTPANCSKKLEEKLNVRAHIFEAPDTLILIDQDHTVVLNNFVCVLSKKDVDSIIKEIESVMKKHDRVCKDEKGNAVKLDH